MSVDNNVLAEGANEAVANGYADKHTWNVCRVSSSGSRILTHDLTSYISTAHTLYKDVKNDLYEGWKRLKQMGLLISR
jgi:hypothetical protein